MWTIVSCVIALYLVFAALDAAPAVHHQRGVHRYNYGDVPWFDMLLGTFRNPERAPSQAGFHDGGSNRIFALLMGREIA